MILKISLNGKLRAFPNDVHSSLQEAILDEIRCNCLYMCKEFGVEEAEYIIVEDISVEVIRKPLHYGLIHNWT